ncbi:head maturation protease [Citrobacter phage CF1 ERZ-2017]|uniref:Prohead core protein protease n=1 Tax=Citrobacter phage CF1 ERZ-2017 TaxID=2267236 RepID=A0A2H4YG24_9CAUD|nr:head maturation protease [Citrobacter phage CF1 ERZ-2017]AUE22935.1 prohead core protein protease [Citrobacter phage CF1 ERZ-2017]
MVEAVIAKAGVISRNGTMYTPEALEKAIDYDKIRAGKIEAMRRFKLSYDKAKAEGTITYKKI